MYKAIKVLLVSAILVGSVTLGAYAANSNEGAHDHGTQQSPGVINSSPMPSNGGMSSDMSGHEGMHHGSTMQNEQSTTVSSEKAGGHEGHSGGQPQPAAEGVEGGHGGHGGHGDTKSSASQGPDWPVIYGFGAVNLAVITTAALKRYVFKARSEVK